MEHTPGPWTIGPKFIGTMSSVIKERGNGKLIIAHIDDVDGFEGDTAANARLIAAAPELLKALEEWSAPYIDYYVGFIESGITERLERTRAAIEAAKGDA